MRKMFFAAIMAACLVLTGCSGVSQEEYDNLVSQNAELQSQNDQLHNEINNMDSVPETATVNSEEISQREIETEDASTESDYIPYTTPNGALWLICDDDVARKCYTMVNDELFYKLTDAQIIDAIYDIVEDFAFSYLSEADYALLSYLCVWDGDGSVIGYATLELNVPSEKGITWLGRYEHYNNHSCNISNAKDFSNFGGSKSNITIDNYNICFSGEYSLVSIDEADGFIYTYLSLSDSEATELIAVEVDVENKAYISRRFDVFVDISDPNGKRLVDCSSCFDDGIGDPLVELPSQGVVSKRIYIPYEGDGEYKITFFDPYDIDTVKQIYIIEVKKP